ncbi:hypothetical protein B0H19DRAFT_1129222 [Mycena capillaripes]|nr:hypothetical protein B0H19DRAFT_1129222 [Mycena capillaripes]
MKVRHETDIATHRKTAAGLTRDKSDLEGAVDCLKAEAARLVLLNEQLQQLHNRGGSSPSEGDSLADLHAIWCGTANPLERVKSMHLLPQNVRTRQIFWLLGTQ